MNPNQTSYQLEKHHSSLPFMWCKWCWSKTSVPVLFIPNYCHNIDEQLQEEHCISIQVAYQLPPYFQLLLTILYFCQKLLRHFHTFKQSNMLSTQILRFLAISVLILPSYSLAASIIPTESKSVYYLTNCFRNTTDTSRAEIDYYTSTPKSFPASKPRLISILSSTDSIDYEDGTVYTPSGSPFNITVVIGVDAYTAKAGTVVGSAIGSSFKGTLDCTRLTRIIVYEVGETKCFADYACA